MARTRTLDQLAACLRGTPPADCDWQAVVALANQSLVTPALDPALAPPEIAPFLEEVRWRNAERNRRLWTQLNDAVAALNAAGVEPMLLKGAPQLRTQTNRLLSDIDLQVPAHAQASSLSALESAGFEVVNHYPGDDVHVFAELARPQDCGYLDLHQRPPGPRRIAELRRCRTLELDTGRALLPDPATRILHLVLHDQFHDGDYWRGGFDLRHLIDLAGLAPQLSDADWAWLHEACGTDLVRGALDAQLHAAQRLIGGFERPPSLHARWTYRRWRVQYANPSLRLPLGALTAALEWPTICAHREFIEPGRDRRRDRFDRYRKIAQVASGKI